MAKLRMNRLTRKEWKRTLQGLAFCSPWIIGFLVFFLLPMLSSLYYSFTRYSVLQPPIWRGLYNYGRLLTEDRLFWLSLGNTLYYTIVSNLVGGVVALVLAMLLNMKIRGLAIYRTVYYIPVIVPGVASAVIWMWLFNPQFGLLNFMLEPLGVPPIPWLTEPSLAKNSLILMGLWSIGNTVVILLAALQDVPVELLEAAELDGASGFRKIRHITLPMISPVLFYNLVMGTIGGLQIFTPAYVMTGGGPADSTLFYALRLYTRAFRDLRMGMASAMAWLLFALIVVISIGLFKSSKSWVYYAAGGRG